MKNQETFIPKIGDNVYIIPLQLLTIEGLDLHKAIMSQPLLPAMTKVVREAGSNYVKTSDGRCYVKGSYFVSFEEAKSAMIEKIEEFRNSLKEDFRKRVHTLEVLQNNLLTTEP